MANNLATFICRQFKNPGSVNLLEPSGRVQACYKESFTLMYILWFFGGTTNKVRACRRTYLPLISGYLN